MFKSSLSTISRCFSGYVVIVGGAALWLAPSAQAVPAYKKPQSVRKPLNTVIVEGFQLDAKFAQDQVEQFTPVNLIVALKNTTLDSLGFGATSAPEHDFIFTLTDSLGKQVPPTRFGRQVHNLFMNNIFSSPGGLLTAHQEAVFRFNLSALYDLTIPDTYYLTLERQVPTRDHKSSKILRSAKIKVVIYLTTPNYVQPTYTVSKPPTT